ncbi:DNA-directed RNA polymerase [Candidatus Woesearchaeota archaeon]|nr:DNA-directed RNA polymerase [Candidatus Woesearchaeota archaeon]
MERSERSGPRDGQRRSFGRDGGQGGRGGGFNRGGPRRDFDGPREMHKATCSECGQECEVPFKPTEGKPVYCRECYRNKRSF